MATKEIYYVYKTNILRTGKSNYENYCIWMIIVNGLHCYNGLDIDTLDILLYSTIFEL